VRELAGNLGVNNKIAKQFVESYAAVAVRETKKNGVFVIPGIGRLVRVERKARIGGTRPPGNPSNPREESGEVPGSQSREGLDRSAEEEVEPRRARSPHRQEQQTPRASSRVSY